MLLFEPLIGGIAQGCIYGLIALGIVLIYKTTDRVSFLQGEWMMLGAFGGLVGMTMLGFSYWLAVASTLAAMAACGLVFERMAVRPVLGQPALSMALLTLGMGYVARGAVTMLPGIGTDTQVLPVPYGDAVWNVAGLGLNVEHLVVICTTAVVCALLLALLRYSKLGMAMSATSQNPLAAHYMGVPIKRLHSVAWGLAAVLAAIAGLLMAPITFVHANMGFIGLKAFPAAMVGGLGSLPGAMVGGLLIGSLESLSDVYLPDGFKDVTAYMLVLLMLALKPHGLFGKKMCNQV